MVGGSLRVLQLLPPLKLVALIYNVAEILLKVALNTNNFLQRFSQKKLHHFVSFDKNQAK
jgi:hypothetical protein